MKILFLVVTFCVGTLLVPDKVHSLNNGLLRTPPMGWMSWLKYACEVNCHLHPQECIDENLYKGVIDEIVKGGYFQAGYNTVNIDDCWSEFHRDPSTSKIVASKSRFPNGIPALVEYAHSKKVQLGIYGDVGTKTCGGYPGTRLENGSDYTLLDSKMFSEWKVDSLKLDGCYENSNQFNKTYPEFTKALALQSHKIAYACSWPAYLTDHQKEEQYPAIEKNCNYWRNYGDISDSWASVSSIINYYGNHNKIFAKYHGPGAWFDPDMLIIGNDGLSYEQSKAQMALWCIWAAPLLMSNDLRTIKPEFKEILLNKHLIAVNQDPLGKMGILVKKYYQFTAWSKLLSVEPGKKSNSHAIVYLNQATIGVPSNFSHTLQELIPGYKGDISFDVFDLYDNYKKIATLHPKDKLNLRVKTSGSVMAVKLVPHA